MSSMKLRDVANTSKIQCAPSVAILMKRRTSGRVPVILKPFYWESWSRLSTVKSGPHGGETVQFVAVLMERRRQPAYHSDREKDDQPERRVLASHPLDFLTCRDSTRKMTPRRMTIRAPFCLMRGTKSQSHMNP